MKKALGALLHHLFVWPNLGGGFRTCVSNTTVTGPTRAQILAARGALSRKNIGRFSQLFDSIRRDRSSIIDVGANVGHTALLYFRATRHINDLKVGITCVEPYWPNFKFLQRNLRPVKNWRLVPVAIASDSSCGIGVAGVPASYSERGYDGSRNTGLVVTEVSSDLIPGTEALISLQSLRSIVANLPLPEDTFFVKVDIEGHELAFLKQAQSWFESETVFEVELNPQYTDTEASQEYKRLMHANNYVLLNRRDHKSGQLANVILAPKGLQEKILENCEFLEERSLESLI